MQTLELCTKFNKWHPNKWFVSDLWKCFRILLYVYPLVLGMYNPFQKHQNEPGTGAQLRPSCNGPLRGPEMALSRLLRQLVRSSWLHLRREFLYDASVYLDYIYQSAEYDPVATHFCRVRYYFIQWSLWKSSGQYKTTSLILDMRMVKWLYDYIARIGKTSRSGIKNHRQPNLPLWKLPFTPISCGILRKI